MAGRTRPPSRPAPSSPSASTDRKSTRLNSSLVRISYAVFCLKKKNIVMISGLAPGTQALVGGSTHFAQTDGTALIAAISQGADLVLIGAATNKFPFSPLAQKNIRQPTDLIGKKVGIVAFGG